MISQAQKLLPNTDENDVAIEAFIRAQRNVKGAHITGTNPHFKSEYSTLKDVWDACFEAFSNEGFAITQAVMNDGARTWLQTALVYKNGRQFVSECPLITNKTDMQALGSAITYARRYSLAALVGVMQDDDDGEATTRDRVISQPQQKRLFAIANSNGWEPDQVKGLIAKYGYDSTAKILTEDYNEIIQELEQGA